MTAPDKKQMRSAARLYAVQALFQMEASGQSADRIQREFLNWRIGREGEDDDMVGHRQQLDAIGDDDHRLVVKVALQSAKDLMLGGGIDCRQPVVDDQHRAIAE